MPSDEVGRRETLYGVWTVVCWVSDTCGGTFSFSSDESIRGRFENGSFAELPRVELFQVGPTSLGAGKFDGSPPEAAFSLLPRVGLSQDDPSCRVWPGDVKGSSNGAASSDPPIPVELFHEDPPGNAVCDSLQGPVT